jgi:hypothetical protein
MRFLTHSEVLKQQKLRDLAMERRRMRTKEIDFLTKLKEFNNYYSVNRRIQIQRGDFNRDFEN